MLFALVRDAEVIKYADFDVPPVLSETKGAWLEVTEVEAPDYEHLTSTCERTVTVTDAKVLIKWEIKELPLNHVQTLLINLIKKETSEAILSKYPEHLQRNILARTLTLHGKALRGSILSQEEQVELLKNDEVWTAIDSLRVECVARKELILTATSVEDAYAAYIG